MLKQLFLIALFLVPSTLLFADVIKYEKNIGWVSNRDLTSSQFSAKFKKYKNSGYLMIDVDAYNIGSKIRYAMVWRKNTDRRGWAEHRDMSSDQYNQRWTEYKNKGYRPIDIESYQIRGNQKYAGIWVQNKEGYVWYSKRNLTGKEYGDLFKEKSKQGYRLVDMEAYSTNSGLRYSCIWYKNKDHIKWSQLRNMTRDSYQKEVDKKSKAGYMVVDYETYSSNGKQLIAAIWEKHSGFSSQVRTGRSAKQFANLWREYRDKGYRLVDFEYAKGKYGGIWIENASRYRYSKKGELDKLIKKYRKDGNIPGISVAIIKDGKSIYRRGFGWSDVNRKKVAHGETVYNAASISKVIGGTIAAKLHARKKLQNGQRVDLDLNKKTSDYLKNIKQSNGSTVSLPSKHKHTLAQLYSHLGCIKHYSGGPEPSSGHYKKAIDALPQIWNASFVPNCTLGNNRNYSTHAHTYLAAVLEKVTKKTSAQLVQSEIAKPYGLSSMRVLWGSTTVPSNYDRAVTYKDNNTSTNISDNSWKVFGGGIEVSPVDLVSFGWKVLDNKIVTKSTRDNILWKKVKPSKSNYAIAWDMLTRNNRQTAEHGGSFTGSRTLLQVFRDDGLVIVIMTNRKNQPTLGLTGLSAAIANIVL